MTPEQKLGFETNAQTLAGYFADVLCDWFTPEEWAEMKRRNATPEYDKACASHDFCDANEAMLAAFKKLFAREPLFLKDGVSEAEQDLDLNIWNRAWDIAKAGWLTDGCEHVVTANQAVLAAGRAS